MNKKQKVVYFPYSGTNLLDMSLLNKGNAFSAEERQVFNLEGLLPHRIESIEEQVKRAYGRIKDQKTDLEKHIYLRNLQDTNETMFYRLILDHFEELLPLIYTPTVGLACEKFSQIYRERRGLFLSYPNKDTVRDQIWNVSRKKIKVIVITDGERILGLGDLGTGGIGIPIGKLSLYTGGGGISPAYTLPIYVDVGTNNQKLLEDEFYVGWRNPRISDAEYYAFMESIMFELDKRWPGVLIQFEDFGQNHAFPLLENYKNRYCTFNDDIQGTAAITLGTLLAACQRADIPFEHQNIVLAGAGSAACGIADLLVQYKRKKGIPEDQAYQHIYLHNSKGLVCADSERLQPFQKKFVKDKAIYADWSYSTTVPTLHNTIKQTKSAILVGVSGQAGLFTQEMVEQMAINAPRPIIFPLSNPTSKAEAEPKNIIEWTKGQAIVAVGSPFDNYMYQGTEHSFAQCNNCYIFPGIGLAAIAVTPKHITDNMILAAAETLAEYTKQLNIPTLLPRLNQVPKISRQIAFALSRRAILDGNVLPMSDEEIWQKIDQNYWIPEYRTYKRTAF